MPRINIEDSLFRDNRWFNLILKVKCQYKALGLVAQAWVLAQNNWIEHRSVPVSEWIEDLNVLIEVGLAEKINDELIYVKGSKKAFLWLEQRVEAGRRGGLSTQNNKRKKQNQAVGKRSPNSARPPIEPVKLPQADVKPLSLSLDLDLTHTLDLTNTNTLTYDLDLTNTKKEDLTNSTIEEKKKIEEIKFSVNASRCSTKEKLVINPGLELNRQIWEAYKSAYEKKYRVTPVRNAKTNSIISALGKRLGTEAVQVVEFFVGHPSSFYINKTHDISCCLADAESLRTQMVRGKAITRSDLRRYEQAQERNSLREAIERGEI